VKKTRIFVKKTLSSLKIFTVMGAFHAYDIRGIYNKDFNKEDVYKIGFFLPQLLDAPSVLIGRDVRASSPEIFQYLCQGINDAGCDVFDAGHTTTPMIYWATAHHKFKASVMITASHNPKEYNGLKVSAEHVVPVGYDNGLKEIENHIQSNSPIVIAKTKGTIKQLPIQEEYLKFLSGYKSDFSNLNLCIDCSNGMAALLSKEVLGDTPHYLFDELDGTFPNHDPNPLNPKNLKHLQALVSEKQADLGVIFDGDADRVMFVDENGQFIPPDLLIALMGHYFLEENNQKGWVIQDIRSSRSVAEYLEPMGAKVYTWKVGRAFAANKLREIDGVFGGELAGHYYFRDFNYSDSAFVACLIILKIVSKMHKEGLKVSQIIKKIKTWENSGEINFKINQKDEAIAALTKKYLNELPERVLEFDGFRIEFEDWWFNVRKSNTEPYLRLLVEAKNQELLENKVSEIKQIIEQYI
jgi:phosphomannomutase